MFETGDKIVYPMHGAGIIESIEKKDFLGEIKEYMILRIPVGNIRISIPRDNAEEVGVRLISSKEDAEKIYELLAEDQEKMPSNWNQRYRANLERLKSGDIFEVADVVRNLTILHRERTLSMGEKKMLTNAENILISELVIIEEGEVEDITKKIQEIIQYPEVKE